MSATIPQIVSKYLTNEKALKVMVTALVTLDEELDGTLITDDKEFDILNKLAGVF